MSAIPLDADRLWDALDTFRTKTRTLGAGERAWPSLSGTHPPSPISGPPPTTSLLPMAITRNSSARTTSPTPSEDSEMYWEHSDDHRLSPSPAPSQTADVNGWDSDSTPGPMDSLNSTPTPLTACISPPPSVVEISRDDYPPLAAPTPATATKARTAKATKASKGKGKAKHATTAANAHTNDLNNPFLATNIARATAESLGLTYAPDDASNSGASSSRHLKTGGESPSKRLRANSVGNAPPRHRSATSAATVHPAAPHTAPPPAPAAMSTAMPALAPVAVPAPTPNTP
ncbi:hypothetical protein B0H14DRAFT_3457400 [Mycena olivaceomarginata]|nr:hypothetical protein B0H14DRAFT_3457400 [Mycena olivaceomarginata]